MTLEQYAYIAEIIGVILVIASLIYVAQQLHQTSEMMRATHANDLVNINMGLVTPLTSDHDLAQLWINAGSNFDKLESTEQQRMILFEWRAIQAWHNWFNLRQKNLISDSQWGELIWIFENIGRRQSIQEAWKVFGGSYTQQFQDFMAGYLKSDAEPQGD